MASVVSKTGCRQVEGSDFTAKKVEHTTVSAQFTGKKVDIPKDSFLWSNHFIECTNGMLEGKKNLRKFWYRSWMYYLCFTQLYIMYCIASFLVVWIHFGVAMGFFVISFLIFILSCQYIAVCATSLHLVKKQPVVKELSSLNDFVELNVNHLSAEYIVAKDAGCGRLCAQSGTIEFQVFSPEAVKYMNSAVKRSAAIFILSMAQLGWAGLWIIIGAAVSGSLIPPLRWGSNP